MLEIYNLIELVSNYFPLSVRSIAELGNICSGVDIFFVQEYYNKACLFLSRRDTMYIPVIELSHTLLRNTEYNTIYILCSGSLQNMLTSSS